VLKRLELYWRKLWIRALSTLMRRPTTATPDWSSRPRKVLFLRHDRIGDMIVSTAAMRAIAESHPDIELDVLASPANAPVLEGASYVRKVIVFDRRDARSYVAAARRLRGERYDAVIDCMVTAPSVTTLLLMLATDAPYRVGIAGRENDDAINVAVPSPDGDQLMAIRLGALSAAFGIDPAVRDWRPELVVSPARREAAAARWRAVATHPAGQRVLVNVSAGAPSRQWQTEKYTAVIDHIRQRLPDAIVLVTGAPNEHRRIEQVAAMSGATPAITPSLNDAFALVATADFVLTPETSIVHAASAFRRPAVALYRHRESLRWGLHPEFGENVENAERTLLTLEVQPVLAAIDRVLARRG
jgi:ADP-heptose:LPS heptosyltransferase